MSIILKAKQREDLSRGVTKQIRRDGNIPAVVYGKEKDPVTVSINNIELLKTVRDEGRNAIISLDIENGNTVEVMLHEYQTDPVKGDVIHADFYIVDLTEEIDVSVTVRLEGEAIGVKDGGVLQQPLYELQIRVKPRDIPEEIVIDVTDLEIGDSVSISALPTSDLYEYLDDADTALVSVLAPEAEEEPAEEVDFSAEPELVGAEDDEEEEE